MNNITKTMIAFAATTALSQAATIMQTVDNIDWNDAMWGGAAPTSGNDYESALVGTNRFRISADGSSSTFDGDSIAVIAGTRALMKTTNGNTSTVNGDFTLAGGRLSLAPNTNTTATLAVDNLIVSTASHIDFSSNTARFIIDGTLTGSGDLLLDYEAGSNAGTRSVSFTGINAYSGSMTVAESVDIDFGLSDYTFLNSLDLSSGSILTVDGSQTLTFAAGDLIDAVNGTVAAGTYSTADLGANYAGDGTIVVAVPEPSSSILLVFGGIALILHRRR